MDDGGCCGGAGQAEAQGDAYYRQFGRKVLRLGLLRGARPWGVAGWHDLAYWQFLDASFQHPSEPSFEIFAGVGHGPTSCRSWVSAREARDLTVPGRHPRTWAISASDQPPQ